MSRKCEVISDGACSGNLYGAWACLVRSRSGEKILKGTEQNTTSNRMELKAAIKGLSTLKIGSIVRITTDSTYVIQGITEWVPKWRRSGWITGTGTPVKNQDLWQELDALCKQHTVSWQWVKGHSTHEDNCRVDKIARDASQELKREKTRSERRRRFAEDKSPF